MKIIGVTKSNILKEIEKTNSHGYKLAKNLDLPLSTVYGHLKDLKKLELIKPQKKDRQIKYELTDKGKLMLEIIE